MSTIRCASIDAQSVYQGMVEIDDAELTDRHLTSIPECDLPPGQYRWIPEAGAPYGGQFVALKFLDAQARLQAADEKGVKAGDMNAAIDRAVTARLKALLGV